MKSSSALSLRHTLYSPMFNWCDWYVCSRYYITLHNCYNVLASIFYCRFLGQVNSQGTAFQAPTLATGLGSYIAQVYTVSPTHCLHATSML